MDAVFARLVAGGGDDAPLVGLPADDDWLATQLGPIEKLHRHEESVHVHMKNGG
jgi:hypothetical protein